MALTRDIRRAVTVKTLRVPAIEGGRGDGAAVARQLDVALASVGFKCSRGLLEHDTDPLGCPRDVAAGAVWTMDGETVRRLALDGSGARHVGHRIAGARGVTVIPGGARVQATRRVTGRVACDR